MAVLGLRFCARAFSSCGKWGGHSSSRCVGLSLSRPLLLRSTGSRCAGSVIVAHGPSCSAACGILPDQGSNPCPLHWQADSQPLRHQGSPLSLFLCMVWRSVLTSLIYMQLSSFPSADCWRHCLFSIAYSCLLCRRLIDHRCVGWFLGSLFCSIDPYVCFCARTMLSWLL